MAKIYQTLRNNVGAISSAFGIVAMLIAATMWVFTTFALADELRATNVEMLQMKIDSVSKEIREYKREIRRATHSGLKQALETEMQEAEDEREKLQRKQSRIAGDV